MRSARPVGAVLRKSFLAAGAGVAAVVGGVALAVRSFAQFESSMLRVKAVTGASEEAFLAMSEQAKNLGATTAFTAQQAAEGMGFLGQAGFTTNEIMSAMPSVLNLAAAGQLELADAADITAAVLRGFGKSATEAGNVADILATAAASSNTSVQEMGEGFKFVGPVASAMGISIEETAAAMAKLSDAGLKGSLAGTGLRQALVKLGPDIIKQGGLLPALRALDSEGLRAVTTAMESLGARAGTAAIALANSVDDVERLTGVFENSDGAAQDMADTLMSRVTGAALRLKSAFDAVVQGVGEAFGPASIGFMDQVSTALGLVLGVTKKLGEQFGSTKDQGRQAFTKVVDFLEELAVAGSYVIDGLRAGFLGLRVVIGSVLTGLVALIFELVDAAAIATRALGFEETAGEIQQAADFLRVVRDELADGVVSDMDAMGELFDASGVRSTFAEIRSAMEDNAIAVEELTDKMSSDLEKVADTVTEKIKPSLSELFPELGKVRGDFEATAAEIQATLSKAGVGEGIISATIEEGIKLSDLRAIEDRLGELDLAEALVSTGGLGEAIDVDRLRQTILDKLPASVTEPEVDKGPGAVGIATALGQVKIDPGAQKKDSDNLESIAKSAQRLVEQGSEPGAFS